MAFSPKGLRSSNSRVEGNGSLLDFPAISLQFIFQVSIEIHISMLRASDLAFPVPTGSNY